MNGIVYRILTLRITQEFAERVDKAIQQRATSNHPLTSRSQAHREALAEWLERQAA